MTATTRNGIPYVPEGTTDPAAGLNDSLRVIDHLLQASIISFLDTPPGSPSEGDSYVVGTGTGAWAGHDDEYTVYQDSTWVFYDSVHYVYNLDDNNLWIYGEGSVGWFAIPVNTTTTYREQFTDADLDTSDVLTVSHNLGEKYVIVEIYNGSDQRITSGFTITLTDANTLEVDFLTGISGNYNIVVKK